MIDSQGNIDKATLTSSDSSSHLYHTFYLKSQKFRLKKTYNSQYAP
jgi:hypothetical protein